MKHINNILKAAFVFTLLVSAPKVSLAIDYQGYSTKPKPPNVPLDGGLSLLVLAGAGYGIKRYAQAKKKNA